MNYYRAFDLRIASEIPLPELVPLVGSSFTGDEEIAADIWVRHGAVHGVRWTPQAGVKHDALVEPRAAYFYWEAVGTFAALDGREVWVEAAPTATPELVRLPLLGALIAAILEQRGDFVLHAGAVEIGTVAKDDWGKEGSGKDDSVDDAHHGARGAAVFLGWKGAGKSTMTAALWKQGHRLLSDDIVAIRTGADGKPWVYPGFPQFKLWPASAEGALGENPEDLPELHGETEKRARLAFEGFSLEPAPLRIVFALEPVLPDESESADVEIVPLAASERIAQLIAHSYAARWGNALLRGAGGGEHFRRCAQLATAVPLFRLRRRMEMALLPQVVRAVEAAVNATGPATASDAKSPVSPLPVETATQMLPA